MKNKLVKTLLAAGIIFSATTPTTFAAETDTEQPEKFKIPIERQELELPEFRVNGMIKNITQNILPISVEARFFAPHMDLNVQSEDISYNNGRVGLKDDLGFSNDNATELIFRYKRFTADYFRVHGIGNRDFEDSNPLTFNDTKFSGNVRSKSDFHYLKLQITNPIINVLGSGVDWSYGLTGIYWKGKVTGSSYGETVSEDVEFGAPIPTLGIGAHASILDTLLLHAHISGLPLGGYGHFYDLEAGIRYNPIDLLSISVGYRRIHANISYKDDSGTLTLNGPYAGLRFDF